MALSDRKPVSSDTGVGANPLGDPRAFRGQTTNLKKLAESEKKSDFLPSFRRSVGGFVWELAKIVFIALAIIKPIHYFLLQPFYVRGASMEPNFYNNEYLIIDQLSYRLHEPRRGDVVVIHNPLKQKEFFIKRVIGLPGERIIIADGEVRISTANDPLGLPLDESGYLQSTVRTNGQLDIRLGSKEYYVLGDNRGSSFDSRSFGPIPRELIVGRTAVRAWPVHRARTFQTPEYSPTSDINSR